MTSSPIRVVIGVDVGGTNTDAIVLDISNDQPHVLSSAKTSTTKDITSGVKAAVVAAINSAVSASAIAITQINIGTTHFINAVVQRKGLVKVAVIRLCGPASLELPPFTDIPKDLKDVINGGSFMVKGGYEFDGREISRIDEKEILECVQKIEADNVKNVVISGVFSPVRSDQENKVMDMIKKLNPAVSVTISSNIGKIGLIQRENASILNQSLRPLCERTIDGFQKAMEEIGLSCPFYLTQNDGTIIDTNIAKQFPVSTFSSGPTNSMRGASFLSGLKEAVVVDIGGTTTDVGIITKGFPRLSSSEFRIGGIPTNFRMPDIKSIGLGGGSYVHQDGDRLSVGPQSAGFNIVNESFVFQEDGNCKNCRVTATDVAVAAKLCKIGRKENVNHLDEKFISQTVEKIKCMIEQCVDEVKITSDNLPLILVGGGHILVDKKQTIAGTSEILLHEYSDVANAVGAALCQVSGSVEYVVSLDERLDNSFLERETEKALQSLESTTTEAQKHAVRCQVLKAHHEDVHKVILNEACDKAVATAIDNGAIAKSVRILEKSDTPLSYLPGNATKVVAKAIGDLDLKNTKTCLIDSTKQISISSEPLQQYHTSTGVSLASHEEHSQNVLEPNIDGETGEWNLSEFDVECISIGAGILGSGGGGSPYLGKLRALKSLRDGKKIRIVDPQRFMKNMHNINNIVVSIGYMGAPVIIEEKIASWETRTALVAMQDLYANGYKDGNLLYSDKDNEIKNSDGVLFIDDYKVPHDDERVLKSLGEKKIVGVMSAEIGGLNALEPFLVAAELDLPVLDCDGMGRAFPELQMYTPFIYGCVPYPSVLSDEKGRRAVVLKAESATDLENHFRKTVVEMGCSAGLLISSLTKDEILHKTVLHSTSLAWRIGRSVMTSRAAKTSTTEGILRVTGGKILFVGKIVSVKRETTGGFNVGYLDICNIDNAQEMKIEFQNENLVAKVRRNNQYGVVACVPDLITVVDTDNGEPIPTECVRYGLRVTVLLLPAADLLRTDQALKFVGPQAFGYKNILYQPCDVCRPPVPIQDDFLPDA